MFRLLSPSNLLKITAIFSLFITVINLASCSGGSKVEKDFSALVADFANASDANKPDALKKAMERWQGLSAADKETAALAAAVYLYDNDKNAAFVAIYKEMDGDGQLLFRTALLTEGAKSAQQKAVAVANVGDVASDPAVIKYLLLLQNNWGFDVTIDTFKTSDGDKDVAFLIVRALHGLKDEKTRALLELSEKAIKTKTDARSIDWTNFTKDALVDAKSSLGSEVWARRALLFDVKAKHLVADASGGLSDADLDNELNAFLGARATDEDKLSNAMKDFSRNALAPKVAVWAIKNESETVRKAFNTSLVVAILKKAEITSALLSHMLSTNKAGFVNFIEAKVGKGNDKWDLAINANDITINGHKGTLLFATAKNLNLTEMNDRNILSALAVVIKREMSLGDPQWRQYVDEKFGAPGQQKSVLDLLTEAPVSVDPDLAKGGLEYKGIGGVIDKKAVLVLLKKNSLTSDEQERVINFIDNPPANEKFLTKDLTDNVLKKLVETVVIKKSHALLPKFYNDLLDDDGRKTYLELALKDKGSPKAIKALLNETLRDQRLAKLYEDIRIRIYSLAFDEAIKWAFTKDENGIKTGFDKLMLARLAEKDGSTYGAFTFYGEMIFVGDKGTKGNLLWMFASKLVEARNSKDLGNGKWQQKGSLYGATDRTKSLQLFVEKAAAAIRSVTLAVDGKSKISDDKWALQVEENGQNGQSAIKLLTHNAPPLFSNDKSAEKALGKK